MDCGIDWQDRVLIVDQVAKGEDAFPGAQSFVVESAVNVQFMVKDSKKYAATSGWGFGNFKDGNLATRLCTRPAFPATSLLKLTTSFSLTTRQRRELKSTLFGLRLLNLKLEIALLNRTNIYRRAIKRPVRRFT